MESGRLIGALASVALASGALASGALAQFLLAGLFPLSLATSRGQLGLTFISKLLDAAEFDCRQNSRQFSVSPVKVPRSCQDSQVMCQSSQTGCSPPATSPVDRAVCQRTPVSCVLRTEVIAAADSEQPTLGSRSTTVSRYAARTRFGTRTARSDKSQDSAKDRCTFSSADKFDAVFVQQRYRQ